MEKQAESQPQERGKSSQRLADLAPGRQQFWKESITICELVNSVFAVRANRVLSFSIRLRDRSLVLQITHKYPSPTK